MNKLRLLSAAAVLATLVAAPVMAKDVSSKAPAKQTSMTARQHHASMPSKKHFARMTPKTANAKASLDANANIKRSNETMVTQLGKTVSTPGNASDPICKPGDLFIGQDGERHRCQ